MRMRLVFYYPCDTVMFANGAINGESLAAIRPPKRDPIDVDGPSAIFGYL